MSTPQEERSETPSLLLMISDTLETGAALRSGHRQVRRWSGEDGNPGPTGFCGDPTAPGTYDWIVDARTVTAVLHLRDDAKADATVNALRAKRPDAAVLVLSEAVDAAPGDGTLTRAGELRDVLRLDLEDELVRLEAERKVFCLRAFVDGAEMVPIMIHPDPDPDALSSALAVRTLLARDARTAPIVSTACMKRPENVRMAKLFDIEVKVTARENLKQFDRMIVVDMQPALGDNGPAVAVIDHHPPETQYCAAFLDVRPEYGSVASMMTEYLRAHDEKMITAELATALLYGIKTDTDSLMRGVVPSDVTAYAFLQERADMLLLKRIEKPSYPAGAVHAFGRALHNLHHENELAIAYAGELDDSESHILADLADFCMGVEGVNRAAACGVVDKNLIVTLRDAGRGSGVEPYARALGEMGGNGGGHATMARAVIPISALKDWPGEDEQATVVALLQSVGAGEAPSVVDGDAEVVGGAALQK